MITLTTGLPGAAKTLYTLNFVKVLSEREGRPVYYSGIKDLKLPWIELGDLGKYVERVVDPEEGDRYRFTLPPNAIVVIDEAQRVYRPRANGAQVPAHVAALETHRHEGVDFFFITQHPMLIDSNVRRLVGRHFHAVRNFGLQRSTVHEWSEIKEDIQSRTDSVRHEFGYPREAYGWYKSAEVHTHKRNIPMRVFVLLVLPFVIVAASWWAIQRLSPSNISKGKALAEEKSRDSGTVGVVARAESASVGAAAPVKDTHAYIVERIPRLLDAPESAPIYDSLATPKTFPVIAGCVESRSGCRCYTQQGTRLPGTSEAVCKAFVSQGAFDPYREAPVRVAAGGMGDTPITARVRDSELPTQRSSVPRGPEGASPLSLAEQTAVAARVPANSPWRAR